ncbi:MAG: response regulator transcription factor [Gammaproteobacteria bacterium]|nr:response regulator transcription factor [Gammaproteobacteria bacterium]
MNILIVDDHAIVRTGLRQIIAEEDPGISVMEAGDATETMRTLREQKVDLVTLDINLPGKNGIELLKQIKSEFRTMPVLILSMHSEDQYAIRAIKNGASGYLTKDSAPDLLLTAIQKVLSGGRFITPELAEKLVNAIDKDSDSPAHDVLSDREFEVLRHIAEGKGVSEIGEILHLSTKTISTYRSRLLQKMGLKNNSEIIHYALKNGIIN